MQTPIRRYTELICLPTFEQRYNYLKLIGSVGSDTFGFDRYLNQSFYASREWKQLRSQIIVRDHGCDLGVDGYEIPDRIYIHHMNPLTREDILNKTENLFNPEFLISVSHETHNMIHYGNDALHPKIITERKSGDTCLWK